MEVLSFTEFRKNLAKNLDRVNDDADIVIVSRSKGKNVVVMDLDEYNSINETMHLLSTSANRKRLDESINESKRGIHHAHKLIED
ncbi:MAG: type II toxin-antitoxin system prevent-host-death family antitoxin [Bacteroidota bacterium]